MHELDINLPGGVLSCVYECECVCIVYCMLRIRDVASKRELNSISPFRCDSQNIKAILPGIGISTIYIEIAIAVTDGFAATQATAEHATNVVVVAVSNKTKSEGSEKKVNDFYTLFSRLAQRVFNAVYKAIYHHFISFPLCMWFVCVTRVKDHGKERMEIS